MKSKITFIALLLTGFSVFAQADNADEASDEHAISFALIGDVPYNAAEVIKFGRVIDRINRDNDVRFVVHMGDIKSGSSLCDDATFAARFAQYQKLHASFVYTPVIMSGPIATARQRGAITRLNGCKKSVRFFIPTRGFPPATGRCV
jgi:hypothetical protein